METPVTATAVPDRVLCSTHYTIEGQSWLVVDLTEPYDKAFYALPAVLLLDGCEYGRSAFDSDRGKAYYRTGALFAAEKRTNTNKRRS